MPRPRGLHDREILNVARKLLIERGLSVGTRELARAVGVSEGVLFQRFGTKQRLVEAALETETPDVEALIKTASEHPDPERGFEDLAAALLECFRRSAPASLPVLHRDADSGPRLQDPRGVFQTARRAVEKYLGAEAARGRLKALAPGVAAALLVHALHHVALCEAVAGPSPDASGSAARAMARSILGIA